MSTQNVMRSLTTRRHDEIWKSNGFGSSNEAKKYLVYIAILSHRWNLVIWGEFGDGDTQSSMTSGMEIKKTHFKSTRVCARMG
jgi:hypothetical protein